MKNKVIMVSVDEISGINKELSPSMFLFFQGQTPKSDPPIKPTMVDIVIVLNFLSKVLKIFDKKIKPDTDPRVKKSNTFRRYSLSGSLINSKLKKTISIKVK